MTEKLTINLTEGDVNMAHNEEKDTYFFEAKCPICMDDILVTRIKGYVCDCNIEWNAEVKIKGVRAMDDDEKFQMPLPMDKSDD